MLDFSHIANQYGNADVQVFYGDATVALQSWKCWQKPRGKRMLYAWLIGAGGPGGYGSVGAPGASAGGGGGGGGALQSLTCPIWCVPDCLYLSLALQGPLTSHVCIEPVATHYPVNVVLQAAGGAAGGNASGATPGAGGAGAAVTSIFNTGGACIFTGFSSGGPSGSAGGAPGSSGVDIATVNTAARTTGGCGGGGSSNVAGGVLFGGRVYSPGTRNIKAHSSPILPYETLAPDAKLPDGYAGLEIFNGCFCGGGGGAGATVGATGDRLLQARGGSGAPGSGGGGTGGAHTDSVLAQPGAGGPAMAVFISV